MAKTGTVWCDNLAYAPCQGDRFPYTLWVLRCNVCVGGVLDVIDGGTANSGAFSTL